MNIYIKHLQKILSKKTLFVLSAILITQFLIYGYDASNYVYDACVDEDEEVCAYILRNEDLEVHFYDLDESTSKMVCLSDEYTAGGVATIWYDEAIKVYCYRTKLCFVFDSNGNIISQQTLDEGTEIPEKWDKWKKESSTYTYTCGEYEIRYYESNYFKLRFLGDSKYLSVYNDDNEKIFWNQNEGDGE